MSACRARFLAAFALLLLILIPTEPALATAPAPEPETLPASDLEHWLRGGHDFGEREVPEPLGPFNYLREFDQIVGFLAIWQLWDPDSTDHGGMIEAESGYLGDVIQTDNTLEAIWCWSRYREFSGRTIYDINVDAAWFYSTNFPAWEEEGSPGDNYYRVHNCAWGLTAVLQYKAATGDAGYDWYAMECADYIVAHPLVIDGNTWNQRLDAFCKGWAAGNLYIYGEAVGNPAYMSAAAVQGADVMAWIDTAPIMNMAAEYWAMSSGTAVWGICNSYFRDEPGLAEAWLLANAPYMDVWQDWYSVPGYDWDSSWNVAYGNAHYAVFDILNDPLYEANAVSIFDNLLSYDTDDDGGIMAESTDPDTEDMSWVTSYLCKFGVDRLMGDPLDHDVGVLRFAGIADGDSFDIDEPIPVVVLPSNYGLNAELSAELHVTGDAGDMMQTIDLAFAALDTVVFIPAWIPPDDGNVTLTATITLAGDENPANDSVTVTLYRPDLTAVPSGSDVFASTPAATRNPFVLNTGIRFQLAKDESVRLEIFDLSGRRVAARENAFGPGGQVLAWDGRDARGRDVPAGLYLYRLLAAGEVHAGKLVRLR